MALWNYRGVLEQEWSDRRENTGRSVDECMKLGIEQAEKEKEADNKKRSKNGK